MDGLRLAWVKAGSCPLKRRMRHIYTQEYTVQGLAKGQSDGC